MALKVGQLEKLTNSELQKQFVKDKARGKEHLWQRRSHKNHLENLHNLHEQSRGRHGNIKKNP
jgi:hypothetical protein